MAQSDDVIIKAVVAFHEAMEHPSVGITVEDGDQKVVFAANSIWVDERTGTSRPASGRR